MPIPCTSSRPGSSSQPGKPPPLFAQYAAALQQVVASATGLQFGLSLASGQTTLCCYPSQVCTSLLHTWTSLGRPCSPQATQLTNPDLQATWHTVACKVICATSVHRSSKRIMH